MVVHWLDGGQGYYSVLADISVGNGALRPVLCLNHRWDILDINFLNRYGYESKTRKNSSTAV